MAILLFLISSANCLPESKLEGVTLKTNSLSPSLFLISLPLAYVPMNVATQIARMEIMLSDFAILDITKK